MSIEHNSDKPIKKMATRKLTKAEKTRRAERRLQKLYPTANIDAISKDPEPTLSGSIDPDVERYVLHRVRSSRRNGNGLYGHHLVSELGRMFPSHDPGHDKELAEWINWVGRHPWVLQEPGRGVATRVEDSPTVTSTQGETEVAPKEKAQSASTPSADLSAQPQQASSRDDRQTPQRSPAELPLEDGHAEPGEKSRQDMFAGVSELFAKKRDVNLPKPPFSFKKDGADKANDFFRTIYYDRTDEIQPAAREFAADKSAVTEVMNRGPQQADYIRDIFTRLGLPLP